VRDTAVKVSAANLPKSLQGRLKSTNAVGLLLGLNARDGSRKETPMSLEGGRKIRLTTQRRLMNKWLEHCRRVPAYTVERRMNLADAAAARNSWAKRPAWTAIFAQAFSLVAQETPCLRRSFIPFPWPHLYEHAEPVAIFSVERMLEDEPAVFPCRAPAPHRWTLADLDAHLRRAKGDPIAEVPEFRRTLRLARLPWPLFGWAMWLALHASGRLRARHCGTFGVSSTASLGAGVVFACSPFTCLLCYGMFDASNRLDVRLTFDHRVFDGADAARALVALEEAMHGPILATLRHRSASPIAA
jgi:hypothetical protein